MIRFRKVCHEILCIVTFSMSLLTPRGSSWSLAHLHSRKGVYRPPGDGRCWPPTWTWASISYKLWSYNRYRAARSKSETRVFTIGFPTVTAHYHFRCKEQHDNSLGNPTVNLRTQKIQNSMIFWTSRTVSAVTSKFIGDRSSCSCGRSTPTISESSVNALARGYVSWALARSARRQQIHWKCNNPWHTFLKRITWLQTFIKILKSVWFYNFERSR